MEKSGFEETGSYQPARLRRRFYHRVQALGHVQPRARDLCQEYGVAEPKFEVSENWVTVVFPRVVEGRKAELPEQAAEQVDTKSASSRHEVTAEVTPEVTAEVTPEVARLLVAMTGVMGRQALQSALELKAEKNFRLVYLRPALDAGLIEMTIPDKPRSSKQRYRLSEKGKQFLQRLERNES